MTDQRLRAMLVGTLRTYGYVVTSTDDAGIAGVDAHNNPVDLTWAGVADVTLTMLVGGVCITRNMSLFLPL
jgi:hypothetical protein